MVASKSSIPHPVEWQSDRLRLLSPFITERIREMALRRVIFKEGFFKENKLAVEASKEEVMVALLLVLEINPLEDLCANENGLVRGMSRNTYGKRKLAGEI